jgi:hypothetical protein
VMLLKKRSKVIAGTCDPPRSAEGEPINRTVHVGPTIRQVKAVNSLHEVAIMHLGYLAHALESTLRTGPQLGTARYRRIPVCVCRALFVRCARCCWRKCRQVTWASINCGVGSTYICTRQDVGPAMVAAERHHRREPAFSSTH